MLGFGRQRSKFKMDDYCIGVQNQQSIDTPQFNAIFYIHFKFIEHL